MEGQFKGGFFALLVLRGFIISAGAYTWRGLFSEFYEELHIITSFSGSEFCFPLAKLTFTLVFNRNMEETYSDGISDDASDEWTIRDIFGGTPECMPGFHVFLTCLQDSDQYCLGQCMRREVADKRGVPAFTASMPVKLARVQLHRHAKHV